MKRLLLSLIFIFVASAFATNLAFAQSSLSSISKSLKSGDASTLSQYFDNSLELIILDDEDSYSKTEARSKVQSFFQSNSPRSFVMKHQGSAPNGSKYIIGTLTTSSGSFRTYIVVKNNRIQELSFED